MWNTFLCFLLGVVVWALRRAEPPIGEPTTFAGLVAVVAFLAGRAVTAIGLAPATGALAAGAALGTWAEIPVRTADLFPYVDLAAIWVVVSLGSMLSPSRILGRRLVTTAGLVVLCAGSSTAILALALFRLPLSAAVHISLLATLGAPLLLDQEREASLLPLLVTALGLSLYALLQAPGILGQVSLVAPDAAIGFLAWAAGIEILFRIVRNSRTEAGLYVTYAALVFLVFLICAGTKIPALPVAGATGVAIAIRAGRHRACLAPLPRLSRFLVFPVLACTAADMVTDWGAAFEGFHWQTLLAYTLCMALGKGLGVALSTRLAGRPPHRWADVLPQGALAAMMAPMLMPLGDLFGGYGPTAGAMALRLLLVCGVGIQAATSFSRCIGQRLRSGLLRAPRADTEPRLQGASG